MPVVAMPDGTQVSFPDEMPSEQIKGLISSKFPDSIPQQAPSFRERVGADWTKRGQQLGNVITSEASPETATNFAPLSALHVMGPLAGGITDVVNEAAKDVTPVVGKTASMAFDALPPTMTLPTRFALDQLQKSGAGEEVSNYAKEGIDAVKSQYGKLAEEYPKTAQTAGDLVNLAGVDAIGKTVADAIPAAIAGKELIGVGLQKSGAALEKSGMGSFKKKRDDFVQYLVLPKETPSVLADQNRVEIGLNKSQKVVPDAGDAAIAKTISDLPVSRNQSLLGNENIVKNGLSKEAENLKSYLQNNDVPIPDDTIINAFSDVKNNLAKNPYVVGNGEKAAEVTVNNAMDILQKHPQTASGLLEARKEFDRFVEKQKPNVFGDGAETPVKAAVLEVRQTINNMIGDAVPHGNVLKSLEKQTHMYRAIDNISAKRAAEAKSRISRFAQKTSKAVGLKGAIAGTAATAGLSLASIPTLPTVAAGGLAYGAGRLLTSPATRIGAGKTIRTLGDYLAP